MLSLLGSTLAIFLLLVFFLSFASFLLSLSRRLSKGVGDDWPGGSETLFFLSFASFLS